MPRSNSDNFGDIAPDAPTPNKVPSENAQLHERDLNTTGLPNGVRDDEREIEKEATSGHKDDEPTASTTTTRRRKNHSGEKAGHDEALDDEDRDKEEEKQKSLSFRDRLRSPLGSSLKLDELRESFSNGVEVKYVFESPKTVSIGTDGRFAPLNIPRHRRLQTAAVALWALLLPISLFCFLMICSFPRMWFFVVPYTTWIVFDRAHLRGGRPKQWARRHPIWKYFAREYFDLWNSQFADGQNTILAVLSRFVMPPRRQDRANLAGSGSTA